MIILIEFHRQLLLRNTENVLVHSVWSTAGDLGRIEYASSSTLSIEQHF